MENLPVLDASRSIEPELAPEVKISTKPKLKPSVTPRTFRRFFAPRDGSRTGSLKTNRQALRELAPPAVNSRDKASRFDASIPSKFNTPSTSPSTSLWERTKSSPIWSQSADYTPPLKRRRICQNETYNDSENSDQDDDVPSHPPARPIQRSRFRSSLGDSLRRQLSLTANPLVKASFSTSPHYDTSDFYSRPDDVFTCKTISGETSSTTPFCSAACNTNSLVAVADAEGVVQILETSSTGAQPFKQPLLTIQAHNNAILDLQFSSDDKLLATAAGDQTCQIIDMFTQKALYSLNGHISSLRQVKFQPGSNDSVVATSSRDGNIQIWDLRCSTKSNPASRINVSLEGAEEDLVTTRSPSMVYTTSINRIDVGGCTVQSSQLPVLVPGKNTDRRARPLQPRNTSSITSLSFLSANNPHILISGSDVEATVKVWDIRAKQKHSQQTTPISTTTPPIHHNRYRHFGITSMALSADASRLYTLCKDNTVYVYSSSHLVLGGSPDLSSPIVKPWRREPEQIGAAPIYAFRHERMKISSFYVKLALRQAQDDRAELLAVGSSDDCALLFSTDERSFAKRKPKQNTDSTALAETCNDIDSAQMPIYTHGAPLTRGHNKEVTNVSWTSEGNLVSLSDDSTCRVWRSDGNEASRLRKCGEQEGKRWGYGWADVEEEWDEDSD